ncbi:MAG TPA: hypothetical protein VMG32_01635 [Anaeromyxobacteraceae bacterium]|nr:hypothetical protein [Anaeromyxobacteraceae bacterium]
MTPGEPGRVRLNPLVPWQKAAVVASALSLLASGLAWLPVHYLWGAGAGGLPLPIEPWIVRWHGLSALFGLFAGGAIAAGHVGRGWRGGVRRASGLSLCVLFGLLAASGYVLSYLASESFRDALGLAHGALGVLAFGLGTFHRR